MCAMAIAIAMAASACTSDTSQSSAPKRRLSIATGGTGGVFYPYGGGIAKVISENIPNVEATAEVTAASVDNLKFLKQGTSDLAFTMADTAQDAALARDAFADFGPVPARTLAVLYASYVHLVTRNDSGIREVGDLRGRIISVGAAGSGIDSDATSRLATATTGMSASVPYVALGMRARKYSSGP